MTVWQRLRPWRRSRPFWGGLLAVLSGLAFIASMNLELAGGRITIGPEGFTGYLIAFIMIIAGVLAWFSPVQRAFYGLIALFVAVYSLIGLNLGGFFVGMLLGIVGGGLIFAWSPSDPVAPADSSQDSAASLEDPADESTEDGPQPPLRDGAPKHAMVITVLALTLSMVSVIGAQAPVYAGPCVVKPPSSPPAPAPTQPGGPIGDIVGGIIDFFDWLFGGGNPPPATPKPTPTPKPTACPTPTPSGSTPPTTPGTPGIPGSPGVPGSPSGSPTGTPGVPAPTTGPGSAPILLAESGQPLVGKRPSRMTGTIVTMYNLVFDGVVDLPTTEGTIKVLRFSMSQSDTDNFQLHIYGDKGWDTDLLSRKLTVKGDTVHFYTSRFRGKLLGLIPVDYTPTSLPPPIPLPLVFFTDPDVQLVFVDSPILQAPDLRISHQRS